MKKQIRQGFGWCPNNIINDPDLSLKAIGLWLYINSKPQDWSFSVKGVVAQKSNGKASVTSALQELKDAGYVKCYQQNKNGEFGKMTWFLTDVRFSDDGFSDDGFSDDGFSDDGKSDNIVIKNKKKRIRKKETNKKEREGAAIIYPFDTDSFKQLWNDYKEYKKEQHKFTYKSTKSEQAALQKLSNIAKNENEARIIIADAIANGWKGFFSSSLQNQKKQKAKSDREQRQELYKAMGI